MPYSLRAVSYNFVRFVGSAELRSNPQSCIFYGKNKLFVTNCIGKELII